MSKPYIDWEELEKKHFTEEEIAEGELEAQMIEVFVQARKKKMITQKQLEELCGIKQPMIARIENGDSIPRVDTLIKLLLPLGYTLKIVPKENKND